MTITVAPPSDKRTSARSGIVKRVFDIAVSALLILVTSPLMAAIYLTLRCTSPDPVLFRQIRAGRNGQAFCLLKFRTMPMGAHGLRHTLTSRNEADGHLFKMRDDPRVTPVGRVLRRFSLDELPQLFNVLRGDMSLVGPRPLLFEDSHYAAEARVRLLVPPGLTGLWQVSGRSDLRADDMLRLDIYYVEHQSLLLDLRILARTLPAVIMARGAH